MKKSDQIKAIVVESQRRYQNRLMAISLGFFGKNSDEIKKNISAYDKHIEKQVEEDIKKIKSIVTNRNTL